jgi:hypothetical protein
VELKETIMTPSIAETVIKEFVTLIRKRLEAAAGIAKAAHVCAQAGNTEGAVEIADDIDEELREANRVFGAALTVRHYSKG